MELDGQFAAVATVAERPRESARETIAALGRMGLPVQLLTGDTAERAEPLGVADVQAGLLPEDKRAFVAAMTAEGGRPLMVGDGINDAAALAAAHAGVALSSGTDLAVGASAAVLYHDDLRALPWAVALCRNAVAAVRRNLLLAVGYNLVGMSLAAAGLLHPLAAAVLMVASSLLVAGLSTRVGVRPEDCGCDDTRPARQVTNLPHVQAAVHALAFALQGVLLALLLGLPPLAASLVTAGFAAVGTGLALLWRRWATIPHAADMAFGMLTLGNLGMLAGWWADHRFAPLPADAVCCCAASWHDVLARPGMWLGMLACANLAMAAMARRPSNACCRAAMFTGGNVGMLAGMVLGGAAAGQAGCGSAAEAALTGLAGMTVGMVAGMIVGAAAARQVLSWLGGKGWLRPIA